MKHANIAKTNYRDWLVALKKQFRSIQIKSGIAVNRYLIAFYWDLGRQITGKEEHAFWGSGFIDHLSKDLQEEFPGTGGFSAKNLRYCRAFYRFYSNDPIWQQLVAKLPKSLSEPNEQPDFDQLFKIIQQEPFAQIPWGHNILIFTRSENMEEARFYLQKTIENSWSRESLDHNIRNRLFERQGKAINNFRQTLPEPMSDLAEQTLKDPYVFDFMAITQPYKEKDIENQLVNHIRKFLLELGKGFAFVGQQYHLEIGSNDYYIDLLFYHIKLKCFVVIELKNTRFIPEFAGKLNFYLSAVDSLVKEADDNPTIGILLCRDKNNIEAEFALRDINKPMGVSEFQLTEILPDELKSSLPTIEEIENELNI